MFVTGRPWPVMALVIALLVVLAVPMLALRLGQPDPGALPTDTQARQAYDMLKEGFGQRWPAACSGRGEADASGGARDKRDLALDWIARHELPPAIGARRS